MEIIEKPKPAFSEVIKENEKLRRKNAELEITMVVAERMNKDLEMKVEEAQGIISSLKKEQEAMKLKLNELLRQSVDSLTVSTRRTLNYSEFSYYEIREATRDLDPSLKIGEGGYGRVYRGFLRHTNVAIKILDPQNMQGLSEFFQEVDVLSKVRHPNLVTLIGACPEAHCLIYEFLPNGSLEDRLLCKGNSSPLRWQVRISIAAEICSALIFLHSSKPRSVVHGDLKPANILLDANFSVKLGDFGISRLLSHSDSAKTLLHQTNPKGTFGYMDPEFLATGELTPLSDVYSFGVVILQLLTGRWEFGIAKEVREALEKGNLQHILDVSAGDWPYVQAKQLARLGLRCCELKRGCRPDLACEVWTVLDPMRKASKVETMWPSLESESSDPPFYFMCPILQEIMVDPQVAGDGFTYEGEAIRGWIDSGHLTSPMTNNRLPHSGLLPNHSLHSLIQEWLQRHRPRH